MNQTLNELSYNTQSNFYWPGLHSNRFGRSRLMYPAKDVIQSGLKIIEDSCFSDRKHYNQKRSQEYVFKPRIKVYNQIQHYKPRNSSKRILQLQFTQPHARRQRSHFEQPVYVRNESPAGIRTFYNTKLKQGNRQYSIENKMGQKRRVNQLQLRKQSFKMQNMLLTNKFKL